MSGYVKTFKVRDGDKDKNKKLLSFRIDDEKLLEKYKTIWTKIEDLNVKSNALLVYYYRYIKTKIRIYGDKLYSNFRGLNLAENYRECKPFAIISIDCLFVYVKLTFKYI